jgi:hypothetical protein
VLEGKKKETKVQWQKQQISRSIDGTLGKENISSSSLVLYLFQ